MSLDLQIIEDEWRRKPTDLAGWANRATLMLHFAAALLAQLESSKLLGSSALAEKEGFEPSFDAKSDGTRLGLPSEGRMDG